MAAAVRCSITDVSFAASTERYTLKLSHDLDRSENSAERHDIPALSKDLFQISGKPEPPSITSH